MDTLNFTPTHKKGQHLTREERYYIFCVVNRCYTICIKTSTHAASFSVKDQHPIKFCVNNNPSSNNKTADCGVIKAF